VTGDATWRPRRLGMGDTVIVDGQPGRIAAIGAAHAPDMITIAGRGGAMRVTPAELVFDPRITLPHTGEPKTAPADKLVPSMRTFVALVGTAAVERALELAAHLGEVETGFKDRGQLHVSPPNPRYDPAVVAAQGDRDRAKVAELAGTALEMRSTHSESSAPCSASPGTTRVASSPGTGCGGAATARCAGRNQLRQDQTSIGAESVRRYLRTIHDTSSKVRQELRTRLCDSQPLSTPISSVNPGSA
jgi:hypothetical protein